MIILGKPPYNILSLAKYVFSTLSRSPVLLNFTVIYQLFCFDNATTAAQTYAHALHLALPNKVNIIRHPRCDVTWVTFTFVSEN